MNNIPKSLFAAILFILLSFSTSSFAQENKMRSEFSVENNAIPADFGKENTIIIGILKGKKSYDKYLEKALKKFYTGEYVLERSSRLSSKYSDREKYRYLFDWDYGSSRTTHYSDGMQTGITLRRFYILDRLTGDKYKCGAEFIKFYKAMCIYIENLDKVRQSNQN